MPTEQSQPTEEQKLKMLALHQAGYRSSFPLSIILGGFVLMHPTTDDYYVFRMNGKIEHKPYEAKVINLTPSHDEVAHKHVTEN